MVSPPLISVIVPVYNTEKFLEKCLDSIINQTLKNIEILVINDGSKDNSQRIIETYQKKDLRIRGFYKENGGLSDARNYGLNHTKGDYISFIDSDDYIDATMLEEMYNLAIKHKAEITICDLIKVNEEGKEFRELPQSPQLPEKIILKENFSIFGEIGCFACNKIFKSTLFNQHKFEKGIHFEDIELIPKLILDSTIIAKINKPFYKYFERTDSITKTHTRKGLDMFVALNNVKNYFFNSNYSNENNQLKRFFIFQGYYAYLAYVAYVKDKSLKKEMLHTLNNFIKANNISKKEIKEYKRFNNVYIETLSLKKRIYYKFSFVSLNLLLKF